MRALPISMDFSLLVEIEGSVRYFFLFYFGELLGGSCTVRQFIEYHVLIDTYRTLLKNMKSERSFIIPVLVASAHLAGHDQCDASWSIL